MQITGFSNVIAEVDPNRNLYTRRGITEYGAAGGGFVVTGFTTAAIAATLAANTLLASLRFNPASTRKAYITRIRTLLLNITLGVAAGVPGAIAWQKFTAVTPTGGTARTPLRKNASTGSGTDMTDVRDNNAALTGAPTFAELLGATLVGNSAAFFLQEWIIDQDDDNAEAMALIAGDGIALRTQSIMPGTQTWGFGYSVHWAEK